MIRLRFKLRRWLLRWLKVRPDEVMTAREYLDLRLEAHEQAHSYQHVELTRTKDELQRTKLALAEACNENLRLRYE